MSEKTVLKDTFCFLNRIKIVPCMAPETNWVCDLEKCPLKECTRPKMREQPIKKFEFPQEI